MPLPKRVVEPVHVSRGTIPDHFPLPNDLEAVTNGSLANIVRQLSSLSKHAEEMFGELSREAEVLAMRSNSLQARIDRLAIKVTQLDSNVEEVSLQDIHMRKAFKSTVLFDQQVFSRDTMPLSMLETYRLCDKPPPLDKLNPYREDGKDGLKFYTDPDYFFELWKQEMIKDTERMMHDRGKKHSQLGEPTHEPHKPRAEGGGRHKKRVRQPHNTRERQRQIAVGHGEYIMPQNSHYHTLPMAQHIEETIPIQEQKPSRPNSIEIKKNYPPHGDEGIYSPRHPRSPTEVHYRQTNNSPRQFEESIYQQQQQHYQSGQYSADIYNTPSMQTPSRTMSRVVSQRPSQPPPAPPPVGSGSNNSTPTPSSLSGTPTRARSVSGRESLPPPPLPPLDTIPGLNGPLAPSSSSPSSSSSPAMVRVNHHHASAAAISSAAASAHSTPTHHAPTTAVPTALVTATPPPPVAPTVAFANHLEEPVDLPPPPPTPDQAGIGARVTHPLAVQQPQLPPQERVIPGQVQMPPPSPPPPPPTQKMQQEVVVPKEEGQGEGEGVGPTPPPPPPPPPPPEVLSNGPTMPLLNGEINNSSIVKQNSGSPPPKSSPPKQTDVTGSPGVRNKNLPAPACDARSDLLKAIRDGIKLRKVEKIEQKEVERSSALHDVASILARRVAVEMSDTDSASESEYDSEGWEDECSA